MSPLPSQMTDHWAAEPGTDQQARQYMWPITLGADPVVTETAALAQQRLAGIPGLDLVPPRWLHLTTLISGPADEIPPCAATVMVKEANDLLAAVAPVTITLGRVLYHPRAIMLDAGPDAPFQPLITALQAAASHAGLTARPYHHPWRPHITVAYSNSDRPADPIIEALGRNLPPRTATIRSVSLVTQSARQRWTWDLIADLPLAAGD
jgi:2'-5' RNA ligase